MTIEIVTPGNIDRGGKTIEELYDPAMVITDPEEAKAYLETLIEHCMKTFNVSREEADYYEKQNLLYWADRAHGYNTVQQVRQVFGF